MSDQFLERYGNLVSDFQVTQQLMIDNLSGFQDGFYSYLIDNYVFGVAVMLGLFVMAWNAFTKVDGVGAWRWAGILALSTLLITPMSSDVSGCNRGFCRVAVGSYAINEIIGFFERGLYSGVKVGLKQIGSPGFKAGFYKTANIRYYEQILDGESMKPVKDYMKYCGGLAESLTEPEREAIGLGKKPNLGRHAYDRLIRDEGLLELLSFTPSTNSVLNQFVPDVVVPNSFLNYKGVNGPELSRKLKEWPGSSMNVDYLVDRDGSGEMKTETRVVSTPTWGVGDGYKIRSADYWAYYHGTGKVPDESELGSATLNLSREDFGSFERIGKPAAENFGGFDTAFTNVARPNMSTDELNSGKPQDYFYAQDCLGLYLIADEAMAQAVRGIGLEEFSAMALAETAVNSVGGGATTVAAGGAVVGTTKVGMAGIGSAWQRMKGAAESAGTLLSKGKGILKTLAKGGGIGALATGALAGVNSLMPRMYGAAGVCNVGQAVSAMNAAATAGTIGALGSSSAADKAIAGHTDLTQTTANLASQVGAAAYAWESFLQKLKMPLVVMLVVGAVSFLIGVGINIFPMFAGVSFITGNFTHLALWLKCMVFLKLVLIFMYIAFSLGSAAYMNVLGYCAEAQLQGQDNAFAVLPIIGLGQLGILVAGLVGSAGLAYMVAFGTGLPAMRGAAMGGAGAKAGAAGLGAAAAGTKQVTTMAGRSGGGVNAAGGGNASQQRASTSPAGSAASASAAPQSGGSSANRGPGTASNVASATGVAPEPSKRGNPMA